MLSPLTLIKCVKIVEKHLLYEQLEARHGTLQSQFESDLRLKTYDYYLDYKISSGGVLVPFFC